MNQSPQKEQVNRREKKIQDADLENIMGNLLRYGVLLSSVIVLIGGIIYLFRHGAEQPHYRTFVGEPRTLLEIGQLWHAALNGRGRPIIQLGLFVLIATPILRIVTSIIGYLLEKDYLYTVITLIVLLVIASSF
jgi:uncharacterized membrane protein